MTDISFSNENIHCIFIYCNKHDQGCVAIITHTELLNIIATGHNAIFNYVDTMCGFNSIECKQSLVQCGHLEYNPLVESLSGIESVQIDFTKKSGGWKFEYFKQELFTINGTIEYDTLPCIIKEYLSHQDNN